MGDWGEQMQRQSLRIRYLLIVRKKQKGLHRQAFHIATKPKIVSAFFEIQLKFYLN